MRKGAIGGNIIMLGVFLTATVFGVQSLMIGEAFGQEISESITDLNRIAETKSNAGLYFYNYLPRGGAYATHQATYDLSKKGGGEDIEWSSGNIEGKKTEAYLSLKDRSEEYFNSRYGAAPGGLNCEFTQADFKITHFFTPDHRSGIKGQIYAKKPVEALCHFGNGDVKISGGREAYDVFFNASNNRYFTQLVDTENYFTDLVGEWKSVEDSYKASKTACGSPPYSEAESAAVEKAEDKIKSSFETVNDSYPETTGFKLGAKIKDIGGSFQYGTSSSVFDGTSSGTQEDVGSCDCDTCYDTCIDEDGGTFQCNPHDCNCDDEYEATVTVEPEESRVEYNLKDDKYRIPVDAGWRNLVFTVDPYKHLFQED